MRSHEGEPAPSLLERPLEDVLLRSVVPDLVEVRRREGARFVAQVPDQGERLEEDFSRPRIEAARILKSRCVPSPVLAPSKDGCWWSVSVPIATCTVSGIDRSAARARRLRSARGALASRRNRPRDSPRPRPFATPSFTARFMRVGVSSTIPNCPVPRVSSTGSEVLPHIAISKSWIAAAPFIASAVKAPRSSKASKGRWTPVLMTWPPSMPTTTFRPSTASRQASSSARKDSPVRMSGRNRSRLPCGARGSGAGANCSTRTFVGRAATGMVRTFVRSISSRGLRASLRRPGACPSGSPRWSRSGPCSSPGPGSVDRRRRARRTSHPSI